MFASLCINRFNFWQDSISAHDINIYNRIFFGRMAEKKITTHSTFDTNMLLKKSLRGKTKSKNAFSLQLYIMLNSPPTRHLYLFWWFWSGMVADLCHGEKAPREKPAKWWLFRVFAWRLFAPPHKSAWHFMRCVYGYCFSYLCLARRKVAMRKPTQITIWRVFAWRPFAFSPRKHAYTTWHKSATIVRK